MPAASTFLDDPRAVSLLVAVQRGREGALDELIRLCEPVVRRHARRYAWRRSDVDDVVQEVWLRLILKAHQIRDPRTFFAWLHIVVRRSADRLGHREARMVPTAPSSECPSTSSSAEDEALGWHGRDETRRGVRMALRRLKDEDRRLLLLLHGEDRPHYVEIGRSVGRPVGSLGPSRRRLLDRLRNDHHITRLRAMQLAR
jgi:RNA polymerase sigma factor (sigma-70 family)